MKIVAPRLQSISLITALRTSFNGFMITIFLTAQKVDSCRAVLGLTAAQSPSDEEAPDAQETVNNG